jgi:hypothetical protein
MDTQAKGHMPAAPQLYGYYRSVWVSHSQVRVECHVGLRAHDRSSNRQGTRIPRRPTHMAREGRDRWVRLDVIDPTARHDIAGEEQHHGVNRSIVTSSRAIIGQLREEPFKCVLGLPERALECQAVGSIDFLTEVLQLVFENDPHQPRVASRQLDLHHRVPPASRNGCAKPEPRATRLALGPTGARLAFWFLIYSTISILAAYTIAAASGVGIETIRLMGELPGGLTRGTPFQEGVIKVIAYSSVSGLVSFALIFFGLRIDDSRGNAGGSDFEIRHRLTSQWRIPCSRLPGWGTTVSSSMADGREEPNAIERQMKGDYREYVINRCCQGTRGHIC